MGKISYTKGTTTRKDLINLCLKTIKGVVHHYDKRLNDVTANDIIRKAFIDILGTDKLDYKTIRSNNNLVTAFEIIEEIIDVKISEGFKNDKFFSQFVEYQNTSWGDRPEFYIKNPHQILISEISSGNWNLNRQRLNQGDSILIPTKWYGAKVYEEFERMLSGRIDFVELIDKVEIAIKEKMFETIATEFMASFDIIPPAFKHTSSGGTLDVSELLKVAQKVKQANPSSNPFIAGTRTALDLLPGSFGVGNSFLVSNEMKNDLNTNGVLSIWRGYKLLEIPQFFKQGTFENAIDDRTLYILTGDEKPIKVLKEGESLIRSNLDGMMNQDMTVDYTFQIKYGVGVILNKFYGACKVTD